MQFLKRLLVVLAALLMLAMLMVYLTPLNVYVPQMERSLSARLQIPVSIGGLRAAMLPLPHLELRDVSMGGQDGIALRSVDVSPVMTELLAGRLALHVEVKDGAAHLARLDAVAEALSAAPPGAWGPAVRELRLSQLILLTPQMAVGPLEGKLEFAGTGALQRALLSLDERKLTAVLTPLPDRRYALQLRAAGWAMPPRFAGMPVDELQLDGVLGRTELLAQRFSFASQGLSMAGSGRLDFSDGLAVHAELRKAEISLERLMALLGKPVGLDGLLAARGKLDSRADSLQGLARGASFVGEAHLTEVTARISEGYRQPLAVDSIRSHVELTPVRLDLRDLQVELYGGSLSGEMGVDRGKSVLDARLAARGIAMRPLVEALTNEALFAGRMDGLASLTMNLDRLERFPENLKLKGSFHLRDGTLSKVDLARVASNSPGAADGATRFSDLTGTLRVNASGYHFGELKMASGSLNAEGRIDMTPALRLNGALDVDVKGTAGLVSMPLVVSGTLEQPQVHVSGAALAGAAVGTAVLGPGLGTALGARLGGFMNKLFGDRTNAGQPEPYAMRR